MAIRMNRNGETIFGKFGSGDVVLNLSTAQEEQLIATGDAFRLTEEEIELVLTAKGARWANDRALYDPQGGVRPVRSIIAQHLPEKLGLPYVAMASAPTVTTSTSASGISSPRSYPVWTTGNTSFPYSGASAFSVGALAAGAQSQSPVTTNAAGTTFQQQSSRYLFDFDGTKIEFRTPGTGGTYWIKVNGEYIAAAGVSLPADATLRYITVDFGTRTRARVEYIAYNQQLNEVAVDATAGLSPAPRRGPRCIVVGDSFCATPGSYPHVIADVLGWDDVWTSGMGGTGVVAPGSVQSFEQRFAHDVLAFSPDICWVVGSINDDGQTPAAVRDALLRMRDAYLAVVPHGAFIWSPNAENGPSAWPINRNLIRWGIRDAFAALQNTYVVDPLEQPANTLNVLPSGIVSSSASIGASTLTLRGQQTVGGYPQPGSTIRIDDETLEVKSSSFGGSVGGWYVYTVTIDGTVKQAHAANAAWTTLGSSYITGGGSAGNPSGYGSSDAYRISAADLHPTMAGQIAFGRALAAGLFAVA